MAAQPDPRSVGLARQSDPTPFLSVLGLAQRDPTLLGPAGQQDPKLLTLFGSVLDLAWQRDLYAFGKEGNTPSHNSSQKTQQRNTFQGAIVLSIVKTVYGYSVIHSIMCLRPLSCFLK
jgi:hypothetical protein